MAILIALRQWRAGSFFAKKLKNMIKFKIPVYCKTSIEVNEAYEGESIETKMQRIMSNKEPITDGAPIIYTDRKEGVRPDTNIRTDRWDVAVDAMDAVSKANIAKRQGVKEDKVSGDDKGKKVGGAESIQATQGGSQGSNPDKLTN